MPGDRAPTVRRRRLATELRRLREKAGLSGDSAAEALGWSPSKVSRIETYKVGVTVKDLALLLNLYKVPQNKRDGLITLARGARQRGWWDAFADSLPGEYANYISLEAEAVAIKCYSSQLVYGLFQTEAYARSVVRSALMSLSPPAEIERRVEVRMTRQAVLSHDQPVRVWTVMDEAVLRRVVGGPEVMREQYERLVSLTAEPNVTIQVLPYAAGAHPATAGAFSILEFSGAYDPDVAYLESMTGSFYIENDAEVFRYNVAFDHLRAMALSPDESSAMIASLIKSLQWNGRDPRDD